MDLTARYHMAAVVVFFTLVLSNNVFTSLMCGLSNCNAAVVVIL